MSLPYVIENAGTSKERAYDLYSRLLKDRIIFLGRPIDSDLANAIIAQMLFLEADDPETDITMYINSPGGSVSDCLAMYDTMNYIKPDIATVCIGKAASAGAFLLAAGTVGKRRALINSRIMMHQVSAGTSGNIQDIQIHVKEFENANNVFLNEIAKIPGKSREEIQKDLNRDYYMSAEEAKEYGIIDEVFVQKDILKDAILDE
jgi:ATP-dependent Clp protease, protease subunit